MRMLSNRLLVTIAFGLALPLSAMAQPAATMGWLRHRHAGQCDGNACALSSPRR